MPDPIMAKSLIADIEWIQRVLNSMGKEFDKQITNDICNQSKEFIKGVLYERNRVSKLSKKK